MILDYPVYLWFPLLLLGLTLQLLLHVFLQCRRWFLFEMPTVSTHCEEFGSLGCPVNKSTICWFNSSSKAEGMLSISAFDSIRILCSVDRPKESPPYNTNKWGNEWRKQYARSHPKAHLLNFPFDLASHHQLPDIGDAKVLLLLNQQCVLFDVLSLTSAISAVVEAAGIPPVKKKSHVIFWGCW